MNRRPLDLLDRLGLACLVAAALPASAADLPRLVSPGAEALGALTELRCPTFSWTSVSGASGYELAVFRITEAASDPVLTVRTSLPPNAQTWTPSVAQCLRRGERYAWSVAARRAEAASDQLAWARTLLFEVEAAPSAAEIEQAVATLQEYLDTAASRDTLPASGASDSRGSDLPRADERVEPDAGRQVAQRAPRNFLPGSLTAPTTTVRTTASVISPTIASASLDVSAQIHLGSASSVFKGDQLFLWDDVASGSTALGRHALSSLNDPLVAENTALGIEALRYTTGAGSPAGSRNTAVGSRALRDNTTGFSNTAVGSSALYDNLTGTRNTALGTFALRPNQGDLNTATGYSALRANTTGARNTATGSFALFTNTTGAHNTAVGYRTLRNTTAGSDNLALGYKAGFENTTGSDNIFIGNEGLGADAAVDGTIRIGTVGSHTRTFVAGIAGVVVANAADVLMNAVTGQLGVATSTREVKQDIQDLEPFADRLLALRPVAFRYREHVASNPDVPFEFGLVAEEVAEVFPELVVYDRDGKPQTVKYHLLSSLLLGEMQSQRRLVDQQRAELESLRNRLAALESKAPGVERRRGSDDRRNRSR